MGRCHNVDKACRNQGATSRRCQVGHLQPAPRRLGASMPMKRAILAGNIYKCLPSHGRHQPPVRPTVAKRIQQVFTSYRGASSSLVKVPATAERCVGLCTGCRCGQCRASSRCHDRFKDTSQSTNCHDVLHAYSGGLLRRSPFGHIAFGAATSPGSIRLRWLRQLSLTHLVPPSVGRNGMARMLFKPFPALAHARRRCLCNHTAAPGQPHIIT